MFLIVGLGNPGEKYKWSRHNLGFMVLDELSHNLGIKFKRERLYWYALAKYAGNDLLLVKPKTFMNLSGNAVQSVVNKKKIDLSRLLVVCDDFHLPIGKIRIRTKGSDGGHNGLTSVIQSLGTNEFPRLRIGIGSDFSKNETVDFVLSSFMKKEIVEVKKSVKVSCQAVYCFIDQGIENTMNEFNS